MPLLKKIGRIFAMEWSKIIQYRADMLLWMLAEALVPLISLAVWYTVAQSSSSGPRPQEIFTYYILVIFIKIITDAWAGVYLARQILNGDIAKDLIRPVHVFWKFIANNLLEKVFKLLLPLSAFLIILAAWPHWFDPAIFEPVHVILLFVSLVMAIGLSFSTDLVVGLIAFWLEDVFQIRRFQFLLESVASGLLIPFAVMPEAARSIFNWLPFRYIVALPAELALGQIEGWQAAVFMSGQAAWIIVSVMLVHLLWKRGLKRYAVPGQ